MSRKHEEKSHCESIISLWDTGTATALVIGDGRIATVTDPRVLDLYGLKGF
ncbi:MAG TPA: hypothetical protein VF933_10475 [Streptosporangiaceae bacterium]